MGNPTVSGPVVLNTKKISRYDDSHLASICRMVLRPVIGLFLRFGLPFGRFADICRSVYVDVASQEFGFDGRRTNTSRIALLTGLSRTRVKGELDRLAGHGEEEIGISQVRPASRMLMAWHVDPDYLDTSGKPRALALADKRVSFTSLYEKYSGKIVPLTAMAKELISVGAIEKTEDGLLKVKTRSYMPRPTDPVAMARVCTAVRDFAETGAYNIYRNENQRPRFERFATNQLIPVEEVDAFNEFLNVEAQAFLERADNWLAERESTDPSIEVVRAGVGVYQIAPWEPPDAGKVK